LAARRGRPCWWWFFLLRWVSLWLWRQRLRVDANCHRRHYAYLYGTCWQVAYIHKEKAASLAVDVPYQFPRALKMTHVRVEDGCRLPNADCRMPTPSRWCVRWDVDASTMLAAATTYLWFVDVFVTNAFDGEEDCRCPCSPVGPGDRRHRP